MVVLWWLKEWIGLVEPPHGIGHSLWGWNGNPWSGRPGACAFAAMAEVVRARTWRIGEIIKSSCYSHVKQDRHPSPDLQNREQGLDHPKKKIKKK
jgi:hypothetical protein